METMQDKEHTNVCHMPDNLPREGRSNSLEGQKLVELNVPGFCPGKDAYV